MRNEGETILREDAERALRDISAEMVRGKKFLVTGASGLIGIHFIASLRQLLRRGAELEAVAVIHGAPSAALQSFLDDPRIQVVRGDLGDAAFTASLPASDLVVHAAGYGQPARFAEQPFLTLQIATVATATLLRRLRPGGSFLFVSSSEVYNGLTGHAVREDQIGTSTPSHPRACYIEGKRSGEAFCNAARAEGIAAKAVRLAMTYGPGVRAGDRRALYSFIEQALTRPEIRLLDQGTARRSLLYVSDAVGMMWHILLRGREAVYNVGGAEFSAISDLARTIGKYAGVPVRFPEGEAGLEGAPTDIGLDTTRYAQEFGPVDAVPLREGLPRTVDWFRAAYGQG